MDGKGEVRPRRPKVRDFHLKEKEARAALVVVTGMFSFMILSSHFIICV